MKFSCKKEDLLQALNLVSRAIGGQQALPILGNILLEAEGKRCTVSATDLELSIITSFGANIENEGAITIPAKAFLNFAQYNSDDEILLETSEGTQLKCTSEHAKTVIAGESAQEYPTITPIEKESEEKKEKASKIEVALSSQQIELRVGNTILLSRLIDGKFPDYQQIIPSETKTTVVLPTKELTTTIKRMHYFAKEINNNLTFEFKKGHVRITTPQTQAGQDETTLSVDIKGGDNKIALSSSYLLDFLSHVGDEEVEFKLTDSMHPALFHLPSNDLFLHLIMPLRFQEE